MRVERTQADGRRAPRPRRRQLAGRRRASACARWSTGSSSHPDYWLVTISRRRPRKGMIDRGQRHRPRAAAGCAARQLAHTCWPRPCRASTRCAHPRPRRGLSPSTRRDLGRSGRARPSRPASCCAAAMRGPRRSLGALAGVPRLRLPLARLLTSLLDEHPLVDQLLGDQRCRRSRSGPARSACGTRGRSCPGRCGSSRSVTTA